MCIFTSVMLLEDKHGGLVCIWMFHVLNYIDTQDLQGFSALLAETEGWLYEEGEDEAKQVYVEKLENLKVGLLICPKSKISKTLC